jgi:hypothetical protein
MARRLLTRGSVSPPPVRTRGRRLTPPEIVDQVRRVHRLTSNSDGRGNISETARTCHLSRRTVRKILEGTHGAPAENLGSTLGPGEKSVPEQRCTGCGSTINIVPCRKCRADRGRNDLKRLQELAAGRSVGSPRRRRSDNARGQRLLPLYFDDHGPLELVGLKSADRFELSAAHRKQLEKIRARRRANGEPAPDGIPF